MKKAKTILILNTVFIIFWGCMKYDNIPKGWFKMGSDTANYIIGIDDEISKSGKRSAYIEIIEEKEEGFCSLSQHYNIYTDPDKKIKMTGYIKTENADWARMWLRVDAKYSMMLNLDNSEPIKGTQDWTKCEIVLDVPKKSHTIIFGVLLGGTGKLWFDDISFEDIERKNPPVREEYLYKPTNLDFEE